MDRKNADTPLGIPPYREHRLAARVRDEFGISETQRARPMQAALASAASFAVGAAMPLLVAAVVPDMHLIPSVGGRIGGVSGNSRCAGSTGRGARTIMGEIRVTFWGALEMAVTAGIGSLFGTAV